MPGGQAIEGLLLEREAELETLLGALDRAASGRGGTVVVEGPPGIGKTGVLRAAAAVARGRGHRVLIAAGGALERDFPFGVARQWFERLILTGDDALLGGAAALSLPALGVEGAVGVPIEAPTDSGSFRAMHGLYWLTANLAESAPVLLVLDDAHAADAPSLRFAAYLARRCEDLPVVLAVAQRADEPGAEHALLAEIAAAPGARTVRPVALTLPAVADLLTSALGADAEPAFAAACHEATGGNPFLLGELVHALAADGVLPQASATGKVHAVGGHAVSRSVVARIARLAGPAPRIAVAVAVLGAGADLRHAATLAGLSPAEAAGALEALQAAHVLEHAERIAFAHPIVEAAVLADVLPLERARLHAQAAELLRAEGVGADRIAPHLLASHPAGDDAAVDTLREAGRLALARGAPDLAGRLLRRALDEPPAEDVLGSVTAELGWAELLAGESSEDAAELLERSLDMPAQPPALVERALRYARAAHSVWGSPRPVARLEALIDQLRDEDPELTLLLEVEMAALGQLDESTAARVAPRLVRFASVKGETLGQQLALASLSLRAAVAGVLDADGVADLARRGAIGLPVEVAGWATSFYEAMGALIICDELEPATAELDRFMEEARRRGSPYVLCAVSTVRALAHLRGGDLRAAETDARAALEARAFNESFLSLTHAVLIEVLAERGELDEAEAVVARSRPPGELPNVVHFNNLFLPRARVQRARGDIAGAYAELQELEAREQRLELRNPFGRWRAEAVELALALDDRDAAVRYARESTEIAGAWGTPGARGMALRAEGLVNADSDMLERAVALLASSPQRAETARTLVELGSALRRAGRRVDARDRLRKGFELARVCGATVLAERAHSELLTAGAKPRRLQFSGVESLTASERRICEQAAQGSSNREIAQALFVTAKTVENHLGRAYGKLGISSRDALPAALAADEGV